MPSAAYERTRERASRANLAASRAARDIGDIPPVQDSARKAAALRSFGFFCKQYLPRKFPLEWSQDHLKVIDRIERAVLQGGLFAFAMPRGSGKSTLCEAAVVWAAVAGLQRFPMLVGAAEESALSALENIKAELSKNALLLSDFPEVVYPVHRLENQARRCTGQLHHGQPTYIGWGTSQIVLPTIPGSRASGTVIRVSGITGSIRGSVHTRPDGTSVRPTLVIIDDPQTDPSAKSPSQCRERERIISGAILGLAGPGQKIAACMPCTVIRRDDLADRLLDRSKHPDWQGERTKLVYHLPDRLDLWEEYGRVRADDLRAGGTGSKATEFYAGHRESMDHGAEVAWQARFNHDELSALQHAMNLRLRDPIAFESEYQNMPTEESLGDVDPLTTEQLCDQLHRRPRKVLPVGTEFLTGFVDVQQSLLFYVVTAWAADLTGWVVDYGTWPDQHRPYFTLRDARATIEASVKAHDLQGQIHEALTSLSNQVIGTEWHREDGGVSRIDRCLIDANWGQSTETVYGFCRQSPFNTVLTPSHGRFFGASSVPLAHWAKREGERVGLHWRLTAAQNRRAIRHVTYDTNAWKSLVANRLAIPAGERGAISLFGDRPDDHALLAEHLTAEYRVRVAARGRTVDEWKLRPSRDNHWWDCVIGCAVAASMAGAAPAGHQAAKQSFRRKVEIPPERRVKR